MKLFKSSPVKEVPQRPYAILITHHKLDPDWAYAHLRCVEKRDRAARIRKYRIFDVDAIPKDFRLESYASFDARPDLILFEGYDKETNEGTLTIMNKGSKLKAAS